MSHLDSDQLRSLRHDLLAKGAEINEKLTRLLAGESVDVDALVGGGAPGETPAERLRRFLDLIDERIHAIAAGRFGHCAACGAAQSFAELHEMPWATRCRACATLLSPAPSAGP
jgi:RNA polymerase-binding transcription factor DksA